MTILAEADEGFGRRLQSVQTLMEITCVPQRRRVGALKFDVLILELLRFLILIKAPFNPLDRSLNRLKRRADCGKVNMGMVDGHGGSTSRLRADTTPNRLCSRGSGLVSFVADSYDREKVELGVRIVIATRVRIGYRRRVRQKNIEGSIFVT
ncbi:hypothetical protein PF005_g10958 [Phytophthora fragariae]|uniref:Uncharacterized protein n=1 Tax=Phytophthora fragariae TaxID=53985 RepID=A0A6A3SWJ7_9STRA|nr:hypothetical protein PF003_g10920 [Phytophthora fragariae]KAE8939224.1 hypothetical protein PF009_g10921 [Phytophthora fragariae]KAE9009959.1 hypothetical protein PF011_g10024 [Phytophthora fragariae]KAE9084458.1 hypothetical protein PF010_g20819 [Phytophthora fragariae]KAE9105768.1 hypothetical protein PF006_g21535 [Phytophthora fragariae]